MSDAEQNTPAVRNGAGRRRAIFGAGAAALAGAALGSMGGAKKAAASEEHPVIGSWMVRGGAGGAELAQILFIFEEGIAQWFGSPIRPTHRPGDPADTMEYQTVGGGQWLHTGFNQYTLRMMSVDYGTHGTPIAIDDFSVVLTYDVLQDTFTGTVNQIERDMSGAVLFERSFGAGTGTRIQPGG